MIYILPIYYKNILLIIFPSFKYFPQILEDK
jgi:hypothetical protein